MNQQPYHIPGQGQQQQNHQQQSFPNQGYPQQGYPQQGNLQQYQQNRQVNTGQQYQQGYDTQQVHLQDQSYQQMHQNLDGSICSNAIEIHQSSMNGGGQINIGDIINLIGTLAAVQIQQRLEFPQAQCDDTVQNSFLVYSANTTGDVIGKLPILRLKEHSDCLDRTCLHRDCRPYQLFGHTYSGMLTKENMLIYTDNAKQTFRMNRPCAYTFYCFNRPFVDIFHTQGGQNVFVGKIVAPYYCLKHGANIFDKNNELIYQVETSCFEPLFWCTCPCQSCSTCKFSVYDKNRQIVTEIVKQSMCCGNSNDTFRVMFPQKANPEQKVLLMAAALFLEYRFENGYGIQILGDCLVNILCSLICG